MKKKTTTKKKPKKKAAPRAKSATKTARRTPQKKDQERARFAAWLATPTDDRNPKTQGELAKELRVNQTTLSAWKADPNFWVDVQAVGVHVWTARLGGVLNTLADLAESGDLTAVDAFLRAGVTLGLLERASPAHDQGAFLTVVANMTPDELADYQMKVLSGSGLRPMAEPLAWAEMEGTA